MTTPAIPRVPKFLHILSTILDAECPTIIAWSECGTFLQIHNVARLEREVLPKYFKHDKFASFQRQLNNFGFRKWTKTRATVCTFSHDSHVRETLSALPKPVTACVSKTCKRQRVEADQSEFPLAKTQKIECVELEPLEFTMDTAQPDTLWMMDWSAFCSDEEAEDDNVGMPIELFFECVKPARGLDLEPLSLDIELTMDVKEWQLLAECLA